jgi:hypothetical protein
MINTGTSFFKPWMAARSLQDAEFLSRLGAAFFSAYAVLEYARCVATGDWHDYRVCLSFLTFDLAVAAGIFLKSRFFASLTVLLCLGRILAVFFSFESVGETAAVLTLSAVGMLAAQAGVRGSFGFLKYGGSPPTRKRGSLAVIALLAVASPVVSAWLIWLEVYSANG